MEKKITQQNTYKITYLERKLAKGERAADHEKTFFVTASNRQEAYYKALADPRIINKYFGVKRYYKKSDF